VKVKLHTLTSVLDGGQLSTSRPSRFTSGERAPGSYWIGDWVGPRACALWDMHKGISKISCYVTAASGSDTAVHGYTT